MLWLERNARVFNRRSQSAAELAAQVLEQVELWISARYHSLLPLGSLAADRQKGDMASGL
jgi:polysaccharide pyruvyl transferase WcaK-like protein